MWANLPRWQLRVRACRHFVAVPRGSTSETTFGLLQSIKGVDSDAASDEGGAPSGRVLSTASGLAKVALTGPVSVGASVDLGHGSRGVVLQFDRKGAVVAPLSRQRPRTDSLAVMGGQLSVQAPPSTGSTTFASVSEVLDCKASLSSPASDLLRLPSMPAQSSRRPVKKHLPSGLAAVEALLPLGEGQRVGFVGPPQTGKSTAVRMLLASQPDDVVCVYAAQQPLQKLEKEMEGIGNQLTVVHADPMQDTLLSRFLVPICALHLASQLRASHRRVILILDDLVSFAGAAAELELASGLVPLSVSQVIGGALDSGGTVLNQSGQEGSLSVVAVVDIDPTDKNKEELPSAMRGLWRAVEPSLDVCLHFCPKVAAKNVLPAIDPKELLRGFAPSYQVPLLRLLRSELRSALREGYDLAFRLGIAKQLGLETDEDDEQDLVTASTTRALLAHSEPRQLPDLAVLLCAAVVYRLPARRYSPVAVQRFQQEVVETVRSRHPALWNTLESMEALTEADAAAVLRDLGEALLTHRFDFQLTRPEL